MRINVKLLKRQKEAMRILLDFRNGIKQLLFGGAAGGGKSILGCAFIITMAIMFPGTRYLIGRSRLKNLRETTLNSFFWLCAKWGLEEGVHYFYNENKSTIKFVNGSEVLLKDLFTYPKDPDFDSLGSLEVTAIFIDEGNQIGQKAIEVLMTRMRYRLKDFCDKCGTLTETSQVVTWDLNGEPEAFKCSGCGSTTEGLFPKMIITCNPAKNWVFNWFYKPWRDGELEPTRAFIASKAGDNKKLSKHYLSSLDALSDQLRARLRDGDWEASQPHAMFKVDPLAELFQKEREVEGKRFFLAIDPSGEGKDAAEFVVMSDDMCVVEWVTLEGELLPDDLFAEADRLIEFWNIDQYDISYDSDGLGWALRSRYEYGFAIYNGGVALYDEKYRNLKTQLYFRLARMVNEGKISMNCWTAEIEEQLTQELQIMQRINIDLDGKIDMTRKAQVKAQIGRSPNKADALAYMMRHFLQDLDNSYVVF